MSVSRFSFLFLSFLMVGLFVVPGAIAALADEVNTGYEFNDGGQSVISSSSDLTASGSATISSIAPKLGNGSMSMNGASGSYSDNNVSGMWDGNQSLSFSMWVNFSSVSSTTLLWDFDYFGGTGNGILMILISSTNLRFAPYGIVNDYTVSAFSTNTWYHIVGTRNSSNGAWTLYVNNVSVGTKTVGTTLTLTPTSRLRVGSDGANHLNGKIDSLMFFNRTLTPAEVQTLYNAGAGIEYPFVEVDTITLSLTNAVTGASWPETVSFSNVTGTLTFDYTNITATGFCVTYTGNGTGSNCTSGSSGEFATYFTTSVVEEITGSESVSASTSQVRLNVTALQLFTNSSIQEFNITNDQAFNTTSTGTVNIAANRGDQNVQIDVPGNYSMNYTCEVPTSCAGTCTPTTISCEITGIYDNQFTIGARIGSTAISTFAVQVTNTTLGGSLQNGSTTNGSIIFPLLQGYSYLFNMNATGYALSNTTQTANASTNLYNFSLLTENTFNLTFYNETTNTLLSNTTVTVQLISGSFAQNYTTTNGTLEITLLTPDDYTIQYWTNPAVPRDYYVTLTPQSYHTINLYVLDEEISDLYLPIIEDQNGRPISDATVKLMRYYILTGNTGEYRIVEMAKTDTNGQAVLRVVPNIINYKLIIVKDQKTLTTTPTKFTAGTNTYTLNTQESPLTSIAGISAVTQDLSYNAGSQTFVFTWSDDTNLVTAGCLKVVKFNSSVTTVMDECTSAATGSLIYTVTDNNQTRYQVTSTIQTSTTYSWYSDVLSIDYRTAYQTWGTVGLFLTLIVFLVFSFMGAGSTSATVLYGVGAIFLMSAFGLIFGNYQSIIGILIIVGIILYKARS